MKRSVPIACLVLTLILALGGMTAFAEGYPIVTEPTTLTAFFVHTGHVTDMATNTMTQEIEALTGVQVDYILVPEGDFVTRLNLSLAGSDYPDMYLTPFTTDQVISCIGGNILLPLEDLIEEYAENLRAIFAEKPEFIDNLTAPDGHIYTLFATDCGEHVICQNKAFVYQAWLDELGVEVPQTTEEFKALLIAIRDNDMNGNGDPSDEIPLVGCIEADPLTFVMNAFQYCNDQRGSKKYLYADEAGQVQFGANTPGWKAGLAYLRDLYAEGLLAPETFIQDNTQLKALINVQDKSEFLVGVSTGMWQGSLVDTTITAWDEYTPIPPLEGPDGTRQANALSGETFRLSCAISTTCQAPDVAMRWLDYWLGEEGGFTQTYGFVEGVDYAYSDEPSVLGQTPSVVSLSGTNFRWGVDLIPKHDTPELRYCVADAPTNNAGVLLAGARVYEPYYVKDNLPMVNWCSDMDVLEDKVYYETLITDYVNASATKFIVGEMDLETDWDTYLEELDRMGLPTYLETMQHYFFD